MIHKVNNTPNIKVKFNHELIAIEGENSLVERAVVINNQTQETSKLTFMVFSSRLVINQILMLL